MYLQAVRVNGVGLLLHKEQTVMKAQMPKALTSSAVILCWLADVCSTEVPCL